METLYNHYYLFISICIYIIIGCVISIHKQNQKHLTRKQRLVLISLWPIIGAIGLLVGWIYSGRDNDDDGGYGMLAGGKY